MPDETRILAAGGIIVRRDREALRTLIIHRPRHNDWSFPKGKLDPGETFEQAALREVYEETGLRCTLHAAVPPVEYPGDEAAKATLYWLMTVHHDDGFAPGAEVDAVRWVTFAEAATVVTHTHDRRLINEISDRVDALLSTLSQST